MNSANITAIVAAVAAGLVAVLQAVQGTRINVNHEMTHDRIDGIEQEVVPRKEIDARFVNKDVIVKNQTKHTDQIHDLQLDVKLLKSHTHDASNNEIPLENEE